MPSITYDNRGFSIDGRRVWLVSGTICYSTTPRVLWRDRLRAAREAGLNCVETPVVWGMHESEPGVFDFSEGKDLRAFIEAAGREGLYCILRAGPYVGGPYDFGGLPAYVASLVDASGRRARLREDEPVYLEAVDRYLRALMQQVQDLQIASPRAGRNGAEPLNDAASSAGYPGEGGGPIILMQVEHAWECDAPQQPYLDRLVSMFRQHGCLVPLISANNLWQEVEGTIDTWRGSESLAAMMRQLSTVQPHAPAFVSHLTHGPSDGPHVPATESESADALAYQLGGLIGVGAQFNLSPFAAQSPWAMDLQTPSSQKPEPYQDTPLGPGGQRGLHYLAAKRLCTFASQFANILANRERQTGPVVALNDQDHPASLLHQRSPQGDLIMLIKSAKDRSRHTEVMLANGLTLDLPHANQRVAWALIDANLGGQCTLDYTTLSPWALLDKRLLVVFGPAGATGQLAINGQHHSVTVPTGKTPVLITGDPIHIAVLNQEQIDAAYRCADGLVIGCEGFDTDGNPRPLRGWGTQTLIRPDATITRRRVPPIKIHKAPKLGHWQTLSLRTLVDGTDASYRPLKNPTPLQTLQPQARYGWYRLSHDKLASGKVLPHLGSDRLHFYQQGKLSALLGCGDGADSNPKAINFKADTVVLAENTGHHHEGQHTSSDLRGLPDHLYSVKPIAAGKPALTRQPAGDPFSLVGYAHHQRAGARPMSQALTWTIKAAAGQAILLEIDQLPVACVVSLNGKPIHYDSPTSGGGPSRILLERCGVPALTAGGNRFCLEMLEPMPSTLKADKHVRFYHAACVTDQASWSFAPWVIPRVDDPAWRDLPKSLASQPCWLMCRFVCEKSDAPLRLAMQGMSKGLVYLNGQPLSRYWQQTREGKRLVTQVLCDLPGPVLEYGGPNSLMLFDEHGRLPVKCKLVYG